MKTKAESIMAYREQRLKEQAARSEARNKAREAEEKRQAMQARLFEKMGLRIKVNKPN